MTTQELKKVKKIVFKKKADLIVGKNVSIIKTNKNKTSLKLDLPTHMLGFIFLKSNKKVASKTKLLSPDGYEYEDEFTPKQLASLKKKIEARKNDKTVSWGYMVKKYGLKV